MVLIGNGLITTNIIHVIYINGCNNISLHINEQRPPDYLFYDRQSLNLVPELRQDALFSTITDPQTTKTLARKDQRTTKNDILRLAASERSP